MVYTVILKDDIIHTDTYKELEPDVHVDRQNPQKHSGTGEQAGARSVQYLSHSASSQKTAWNKC